MISRRLLRIKILQILYAHFSTEDSKIEKSEKDLTYSIQKAYDLYFCLLLLIVAVKRYAESRIHLALNKKLPTYDDLHPNMRFLENELILQIEECASSAKYRDYKALNWNEHPELIKTLYNNLLEAPYYKEYMERPTCEYEDDKQLLIDFYSNELEDVEMFYDILEEQSIYWNDDVDFIINMVIKTVKDISREKIELLPLFKSEEESDFATTLLRASINNYNEYHKIIDSHVENWDIERVAYVDYLILQMSINELVEFPSIPIRVTFDEYLELAKYYSTAKSSVFINGLLDTILVELIERGTILKSGRGLQE